MFVVWLGKCYVGWKVYVDRGHYEDPCELLGPLSRLYLSTFYKNENFLFLPRPSTPPRKRSMPALFNLCDVTYIKSY